MARENRRLKSSTDLWGRLTNTIKYTMYLYVCETGESHTDMMNTARDVAALHPYEVKIHSLYIVMNTKAALMWAGGELEAMGREEYIKTVCDQLEILPPDTAIGRLTGDGDRTALLAPLWTRNKRSVLNGIDKELAARGSWQGIGYS